MTARRDLLDDDFAAFIDENARGIGLPASERHYRQRPDLFKVFGEFVKRLTAAFARAAQAVAKMLPDLQRLTAVYAALAASATWEDGDDAARWSPEEDE